MSAARLTISAAVLLIFGFGFATGCADGDSGVEPVAKPRAAQPSVAARRALADPGSAATVVARYWRSVQREALPLTLSLYARKVVEAVGLANFAGMLAAQRAAVRDVRLNILAIETFGEGRLVMAEALPKTGAKVEHTFFLRRQDDRWRVLYDTLTAAAIGQYVQDQTQRSISAAATRPSTRAVNAGDRALQAYRQSALSPPRTPPR